MRSTVRAGAASVIRDPEMSFVDIGENRRLRHKPES
jgi:hypothetical protein